MNNEKKRSTNQKWRLNHKEKIRLYNQEYRKSHTEEHNINSKKYYKIHKEEIKAYHREHTQKTKRKVLTHYGNGKLACVKCGFDDLRALSIDHIHGKGLTEKRKLGRATGSRFYYWLSSQGYPEGYQTLCMNCNLIKRFENGEGYITKG